MDRPHASGLYKEDKWVLAETGTHDEIRQLRAELLAIGWSEDGRLIQRITERLNTEG